MDKKYIYGWDGIYNATGIKVYTLKRYMGYYGFPRPEKERFGMKTFNKWDKKEVLAWCKANEKFIQTKYIRKSHYVSALAQGRVA